MFLGINMFLAPLRSHFNPCYARAKMILSRAKNIFMPANVNSIVIIVVHRVVLNIWICSCEMFETLVLHVIIWKNTTDGNRDIGFLAKLEMNGKLKMQRKIIDEGMLMLR